MRDKKAQTSATALRFAQAVNGLSTAWERDTALLDRKLASLYKAANENRRALMERRTPHKIALPRHERRQARLMARAANRRGAAAPFSRLLLAMAESRMRSERATSVRLGYASLKAPERGTLRELLFAAVLDAAVRTLRAKGFTCAFTHEWGVFNDRRNEGCTGGCPDFCDGDHSYWSTEPVSGPRLSALLSRPENDHRKSRPGPIAIHISLRSRRK